MSGRRPSAAKSAGSGRPAKRLRLEDLDNLDNSANLNTDHYSKVVRAYNTIIEHPLFETILDDQPLPIQGNRESGYEAVYDSASYLHAIKERGLYKSAGNIMWVDMLWSAQPGVPINTSAVDEIIAYYFVDRAFAGIFDWVSAGIFVGGKRGPKNTAEPRKNTAELPGPMSLPHSDRGGGRSLRRPDGAAREVETRESGRTPTRLAPPHRG